MIATNALQNMRKPITFGITIFIKCFPNPTICRRIVTTTTLPPADAAAAAVEGNIVDIHNGEIYPGVVIMDDQGRIADIRRKQESSLSCNHRFILPGFVDAHVHVESSLLIPSEFARLAVRHGTVATLSDPHEIANVCGMDGIRFMLENASKVPFHFYFGAPSCVPATPYETAGAVVSTRDIQNLFLDPRIAYLAEMMNWSGVLQKDPIVLSKLQAARDARRPIDGHAPGLRGQSVQDYAAHGISTDHECFTLDEAHDKLAAGMKVQIREGSAARNFDALHPIIGTHADRVMFCCDDTHPDLLEQRHIDHHVRRSIQLGYDMFQVLRIASKNPIEHYGMDVGLLRSGDSADFIVVDNLVDFHVYETWIKGRMVAQNKKCLFPGVGPIKNPINHFVRRDISQADLAVEHSFGDLVRAIVPRDGELVTGEEHLDPADPDVLKIVVINRYEDKPPAVAYIKGFGLHTGALASTVAHDSHNLVAVGCSDRDIVDAVNALIKVKGGLSVAANSRVEVLPLPIAGLMSDKEASWIAHEYSHIDQRAKEYGSCLRAPFMYVNCIVLTSSLCISLNNMMSYRFFS